MRVIASLLHLVVTAWVAYLAPVLILAGLVGYFPAYPEVAYTPTYIGVLLGTSFLGGTILGRTRTWRERIVLLVCIIWLLAVAATVPALLGLRSEPTLSNGLVSPVVMHMAPLELALGLTAGLLVGARFMRSYDTEPPNTSLERTRER